MFDTSVYPALAGILVGTTVILVAFLTAALIHRKNVRDRKLEEENRDEWLFADFHNILYDAMFSKKIPEDVSESLGINAEKYEKDCRTAGLEPDLKKMIARNLYAFVVLIFGIVVAVFVHLLPGFLLAAAGLCLMYAEKTRISSRAAKMQREIESEIPDFLDLLKTELDVGVPVELAIYNICKKKDDLLSREFFRTMKEMQLGASDWSSAMEAMADRYNVDTLTEFVLETTTAYRNGTSIADAVRRKAESIRRTHLLNVKEKAGKATNTILLPMTICQIIPMIAFLMIPTMMQAMGGLI